MIYRVFLYALVIIQICAAQGIKTTIQFRETVYSIRDLFFVSNSTGYAVGQSHWDQSIKNVRSTIMMTTDGGMTWNVQPFNFTVSMNTVGFFTENNGVAAGESGTIALTNDAGKTWSGKVINSGYEITSIDIVNSTNGFMSGYKKNADGGAYIWATSDRGTSWNGIGSIGDAAIINKIKFESATSGWAVGARKNGEKRNIGVVYKTIDGGKTWNQQFTVSKEIVFTSLGKSNTLLCAGGYTEGTSGGPSIYFSPDGGQTWDSSNVTDRIYDIQINAEQKGCAVGYRTASVSGSSVLTTTDGGKSWQSPKVKHTGETIKGVALIDKKMVAAGDRSMFCICQNIWDAASPIQSYQVSERYSFTNIIFTDALNGWVVGTRTFFDFGFQVILRTTDGGLTWSKVFERDTMCDGYGRLFSKLRDIVVFNDHKGFVVGDKQSQLCDPQTSTIVRSSDGINWTPFFINPIIEFYALHAINNNTIWLLPEVDGSKALNLINTNYGGETYKIVPTGISLTKVENGDIYFFNQNQGYATFNKGYLLITTDGGTTWTRSGTGADSTSSIAGKCQTVCFADQNHGYVGGENLYETFDGGQTWKVKDIGHGTNDIMDIQFTNENNGWFCGENGMLLHTTDGGITWEKEAEPRKNHQMLRAVYLINNTDGWACGDGGTIEKINGNESISIKKTISKNTKEYIDVYPARDRITIKIPAHFKGASVTLYDLKGRLLFCKSNVMNEKEVIMLPAHHFSSSMVLFQLHHNERVFSKALYFNHN